MDLVDKRVHEKQKNNEHKIQDGYYHIKVRQRDRIRKNCRAKHN